MSNLLLSDCHFSAIGAAILRHAGSPFYEIAHAIKTGLAGTVSLQSGKARVRCNELADWLAVLRDANRSAYSSCNPDEALPALAPFNFENHEPVSPVQLLKLLDCVDSSIGEDDNPEAKTLNRLRSGLAAGIVHMDPAYDKADWCL